jgi:DASS family divalent anion:Na+ symporter
MNVQVTSAAAAGKTAAAPKQPERAGAHPGRLLLVVTVGLLIWALPRPADVTPRAWQLLALFVATVLGIIVKPLPMGAIAVVGIAVAVGTRTLTLPEALSGFANATVWLVFAAFSIAAGFIKTGLGERIAYKLVSLFGSSTLGLGYSLAATDLILAPAIASNTARAGGVIFPILQSICKTALEADRERGLRTSAFLTLTAYHANLLTSAMFLTAIAFNPLIAQMASTQGVTITWSLWAYAAVVPGLLSLAVVPLVISRLSPPGVLKTPDAPALARAELLRRGPMTREERLMGLIATALISAWIFGSALGLDSTVAALMGLALMLLLGVLNWSDICRDHEAWNTFVWFATLLMMATQLGQLGLIYW